MYDIARLDLSHNFAYLSRINYIYYVVGLCSAGGFYVPFGNLHVLVCLCSFETHMIPIPSNQIWSRQHIVQNKLETWIMLLLILLYVKNFMFFKILTRLYLRMILCCIKLYPEITYINTIFRIFFFPFPSFC